MRGRQSFGCMAYVCWWERPFASSSCVVRYSFAAWGGSACRANCASWAREGQKRYQQPGCWEARIRESRRTCRLHARPSFHYSAVNHTESLWLWGPAQPPNWPRCQKTCFMAYVRAPPQSRRLSYIGKVREWRKLPRAKLRQSRPKTRFPFRPQERDIE